MAASPSHSRARPRKRGPVAVAPPPVRRLAIGTCCSCSVDTEARPASARGYETCRWPRGQRARAPGTARWLGARRFSPVGTVARCVDVAGTLRAPSSAQQSHGAGEPRGHGVTQSGQQQRWLHQTQPRARQVGRRLTRAAATVRRLYPHPLFLLPFVLVKHTSMLTKRIFERLWTDQIRVKGGTRGSALLVEL